MNTRNSQLVVILLPGGISTVQNTILARLLAISDLYPGRAGLLDVNGCRLTFQELARQVSSFRARLLSYGLGRGSRVALVFPNGLDMALAILGTVSTGTAAPVNPNYRQEEFHTYLQELKAEALVLPSRSDSPARSAALMLAIPVYELEGECGTHGEWRLMGEGKRKPAKEIEVQPEDVAIILHTSGSTARPKLVPLRHRQLIPTVDNIIHVLDLGPADRMLCVMPHFHSHGLIAGLLAPLLAGSSTVCTPSFDIEQFFCWLDRCAPTCYSAVPTIHQTILARSSSHMEIIQKRPLRFIRSASSALSPSMMQEMERVFNAPVIESYGTTEASNQTSNPLPPKPRKPGSVGPSVGPQIAIIDSHGKILPTGENGEIAVSGPNVMDGYLEDPEATAKAFIDGWFRTGDEGYLDEDNYLYVTGRIKEMINRGGEKVTPLEVDQVFLAHPAVSQAVTFAVPHPSLGEDVATAVVLKREALISEQELRLFALSRLSDQKAPSRVVILSELPTTPTGKLERMGLYQRMKPYLQAEYVPASNPVQAELVRMVEEVLKIPQAGIQDNFFYLGGNSLTAAALINRINSKFQIELAIGEVFRKPTVEELAGQVQEQVIQPHAGKKKPELSADMLDYLEQF